MVSRETCDYECEREYETQVTKEYDTNSYH